MDVDEQPRKPPSTAATKACRSIDEHRGTLRALLRLVDPESPFQPILLSSIDIFAWLAAFGRAARQLGRALRAIPDADCRKAVRTASEQFLRLAETLCEYAELHASPPAGHHADDTPELAPFRPDSAVCPEDADAIDHAMGTASAAFEASAAHRKLLCRSLSLATTKLTSRLCGPGGLLPLTRRRCRDSRPFRRQYGELADELRVALTALPDPVVTPWDKGRIRFATVRHLLETKLLPALGPLIKDLATGKGPTPAGSKKPEAPKTGILMDVTRFLEAHRLATSLDNALPEVQYHTLFEGLLARVISALGQCSLCRAPGSSRPRIIDDIRRLGPELIKKDVLAAWDAALQETDPYDIEVALAVVHHLEQPSDAGDRSAGKDRLIFGVSDGDLARWIRSGTYVGADPLAEASTTREAETKRLDRTLQRLRQAGAVFHDRRQWTPTHSRNEKSTQHRLWTVNPLLVLLPSIAARLEAGTTPGEKGEASAPPGSRPRPSRQNRGTRRRKKA